MKVETYSKIDEYGNPQYFCRCCHDFHSPDNDTPAFRNYIHHISGAVYPGGFFDAYYMSHGKHHREEDKPAIIYSDGHKEWYQHDVAHRDLGPASVSFLKNGSVVTAYWINDTYYTREKFIRRYEFIFMKKYEGI